MKLNSKLNLTTNPKKTTLENTDIMIIKFMLDLRDGKGDVDDMITWGMKSKICWRACRKSI